MDFLTKRTLTFGLVFASLTAVSLHAELLTNGGFETGNLSGWTSANLTPTYSQVATDNPFAGTHEFYIGEYTNHPLTLSQTIATTAGQTYTYSLELAFSGSSQVSLFSMGYSGSGTPLLTIAAPTTSAGVGYQLYSTSFTASSASTTISFTGANTNGATFIDNVSVTPAATAAPEPATWGMFALGCSVLALKRKSR